MPNFSTVYEVKTAELNTMQDYKFVVIFTKYNGKWVFCRHKERITYESPGGRIEQGESCLQAARRELYEETGAVDFKITSLFDYSVFSSKGLSNGQVYFAEVKELGKLPESEIANIEFFDDIPAVLTYPDIQPILFRKVTDLIRDNEMYSNEFWIALDKLLNESEVIIDRPKGSRHPKYNFLYEVDYGYLKNTNSMDGGGIDIWRGSLKQQTCDAIICTVDLIKRDSEIKILLGCTEQEKEIILSFHNNSDCMKGIMIKRS